MRIIAFVIIIAAVCLGQQFDCDQVVIQGQCYAYDRSTQLPFCSTTGCLKTATSALCYPPLALIYDGTIASRASNIQDPVCRALYGRFACYAKFLPCVASTGITTIPCYASCISTLTPSCGSALAVTLCDGLITEAHLAAPDFPYQCSSFTDFGDNYCGIDPSSDIPSSPSSTSIIVPPNKATILKTSMSLIFCVLLITLM